MFLRLVAMASGTECGFALTTAVGPVAFTDVVALFGNIGLAETVVALDSPFKALGAGDIFDDGNSTGLSDGNCAQATLAPQQRKNAISVVLIIITPFLMVQLGSSSHRLLC